MGLGLRLFAVIDDDTVRRMSGAWLDRVTSPRSRERTPEFAGQRIRFAEFVVDLENRRPVAIRRASFFVLFFGDSGRLDEKKWQEILHVAVATLALPTGNASTGFVNASHRFYRKRLAHEHLWQPAAPLEEKLCREALSR